MCFHEKQDASCDSYLLLTVPAGIKKFSKGILTKENFFSFLESCKPQNSSVIILVFFFFLFYQLYLNALTHQLSKIGRTNTTEGTFVFQYMKELIHEHISFEPGTLAICMREQEKDVLSFLSGVNRFSSTHPLALGHWPSDCIKHQSVIITWEAC